MYIRKVWSKLRDKGTPFIHTENLWFSYNGDEDTERIPIIRGISIDIEEGSFVAILGHNGSGKSTFAKLLNMILTPDSGNHQTGKGRQIGRAHV